MKMGSDQMWRTSKTDTTGYDYTFFRLNRWYRNLIFRVKYLIDLQGIGACTQVFANDSATLATIGKDKKLTTELKAIGGPEPEVIRKTTCQVHNTIFKINYYQENHLPGT